MSPAKSPADPGGWCQRGNELLDKGQIADAIQAYERARSLTVEQAPLLNNLGNAYHQSGDFDRALGYYLEAAFHRPDSVQILNHLGTTLTTLRHLDAAERCFAAALARVPDYPSARWNRGLMRLLRGDWPLGWDDFEWRWRVPRYAARGPRYEVRQWDGDRDPAKRLLLYGEQGFGDTLQFLRYVNVVRERGVEVTLAVPDALGRLVKHAFSRCRVVSQPGAVPADLDAKASLMSLPAIFRTTVDTIPSQSPYLFVDPSWGPTTWNPTTLSGRRVGIVWAGSPRRHDAFASAVDRRRSLPLMALGPLWDIPGVTFVSLQKERPDVSSGAALPSSVQDLGDGLTDFASTAAVIADLDLVISVDTAVAHLAGALGKPVWLMSRFDGCWRWLLDRSDSPWYPTLRIFRQKRAGDWDPLVQEVAQALRQWTAEPAN